MIMNLYNKLMLPILKNNKLTTKLSFRTFVIKPKDELILEYISEKDEGIAVLGFNRPKQKNALSVSFIEQLNDAVDNICLNTKVKVLVFRSFVPGVFCAGADLKERIEIPKTEVSKVVNCIRNLVYKIHSLPIPVIASLDGLALGGGLEIALACDVRVTSKDSKLGLVETKLGIIPGAGGTQLLSRLVNPSVAKELIFAAKIIDGYKAKELGIVNHVVEQNDNKDAAYQKSLDIAREILPNGPLAIKMAKVAVNRGMETDLNTGLIIEEACYAQLIPTRDRVEGLTAFKDKRTPNYVGH